MPGYNIQFLLPTAHSVVIIGFALTFVLIYVQILSAVFLWQESVLLLLRYLISLVLGIGGRFLLNSLAKSYSRLYL